MKPGQLKRKVGLQPGGPIKRAKRMRAVSQKQKPMSERYPDGFGVYFDEVSSIVGPVKSWPQIRIVHDEKRRWSLVKGLCWYCERTLASEPHHLFAGSRGRCDCLSNIFPMCHKCHLEIQSVPSLLPKVLYQKWLHGREHLSWVRLCHLLGRRFDFTELG